MGISCTRALRRGGSIGCLALHSQCRAPGGLCNTTTRVTFVSSDEFSSCRTVATATSNVIEWIGEMREMREIGIELRMPLRYSSDAAEVVPKGIGTRSYSSGVAQFESVNASVDAGAWFIERHDDFLYNSTGIYNSTDNSTTTIDDGTIVATIGMALSGKVGSTTGPFEGPLMCQDFAGNATAMPRETHGAYLRL